MLFRNHRPYQKFSNLYTQNRQNQNPKIFRGWNFKTAFQDFKNFLGGRNSKSGFRNLEPEDAALISLLSTVTKKFIKKSESCCHTLKHLEPPRTNIKNRGSQLFNFKRPFPHVCARVRTTAPKNDFWWRRRWKNGFARIYNILIKLDVGELFKRLCPHGHNFFTASPPRSSTLASALFQLCFYFSLRGGSSCMAHPHGFTLRTLPHSQLKNSLSEGNLKL